jgi:hypothetical protein
MSEKEDPFIQLTDTVIAAQMYAFAAFYAVGELISDVAKLQPEADQYVKSLYDRVIAHLDPKQGRPEKFVDGQARDMVGAMFRDALRTVQSTPPEDPPEYDLPQT